MRVLKFRSNAEFAFLEISFKYLAIKDYDTVIQLYNNYLISCI
jgi:hypothetical protein